MDHQNTWPDIFRESTPYIGYSLLELYYGSSCLFNWINPFGMQNLSHYLLLTVGNNVRFSSVTPPNPEALQFYKDRSSNDLTHIVPFSGAIDTLKPANCRHPITRPAGGGQCSDTTCLFDGDHQGKRMEET